jgi:hypothetical protein
MKKIFIKADTFDDMNYYQTLKQTQEDADMQLEHGETVIEMQEVARYRVFIDQFDNVAMVRLEKKGDKKTPKVYKCYVAHKKGKYGGVTAPHIHEA